MPSPSPATPAARAAAPALALSLALSLPAAAAPPGPEEPEVPAELLVADWKLGPFYVRPLFSVRDVGWDDNVFLTAEPVGDFTATVAPGVQLALPFGDNVLSLREQLSYVYFRDFATERGWNSDTALRLELALGGARLDLQESFRRTQERFDFEVFTRPQRLENELRATLATDREAGLYLEGALGFNAIRFDDDERLEESRLERTLGRTELQGGLAAFLDLFDPARLLVGGELVRSDYRSEASDRDARGWFLHSGLRFDPESALSGDVRLGYRRHDVDRPGHPDFAGFALRSDLALALGDVAQLLFELERGPQPSGQEENLYYVATRLRARLRLPLAERLWLEVAPTVVSGRYPVAAPDAGGTVRRRHDRTTWLEGDLVFPLGESVAFQVGARYRTLSSNVPGVEYDGAVVTTGFRYGL